MLAAKALPGSPYDGHTLSSVIPHLERTIGNEIKRVIADKGYRGHGMPSPYSMRVFVSEQRRGVTPAIKRELRRRSAVEPVIGHLKSSSSATHYARRLRYETGRAERAREGQVDPTWGLRAPIMRGE